VRRRFYPHRQAYGPALWPMYLAAWVVTVAIVLALRPAWWVDILIANSVAVVVTEIRWVLWRREHPIIEPREYMERMRESAPWN
jgi:hypothetical protein